MGVVAGINSLSAEGTFPKLRFQVTVVHGDRQSYCVYGFHCVIMHMLRKIDAPSLSGFIERHPVSLFATPKLLEYRRTAMTVHCNFCLADVLPTWRNLGGHFCCKVRAWCTTPYTMM